MNRETSDMASNARVQVLIPDNDAKRFAAYCRTKGFKKSTLICRLIREHLDRESFQAQQELVLETSRTEGRA